jgi:ABC-type Fe3+/spermidine/putrescine transport system ATPase subunit
VQSLGAMSTESIDLFVRKLLHLAYCIVVSDHLLFVPKPTKLCKKTNMSLNAIHLCHRYPASHADSFSDINLTVENHECLAVLGASGIGKSTLLKVLAGLEPLRSGELWWRGQEISDLPTAKRKFVLVFQDFSLFNHLSVADNIAFSLMLRQATPSVKAQSVAHWLDKLQLVGLGQKMPWELSGGQQQRVAFARALAADPALLLLDEPFSNLDAGLRRELQQLLKSLLSERQLPCVVVTHDEQEASILGDRAMILNT